VTLISHWNLLGGHAWGGDSARFIKYLIGERQSNDFAALSSPIDQPGEEHNQ